MEGLDACGATARIGPPLERSSIVGSAGVLAGACSELTRSALRFGAGLPSCAVGTMLGEAMRRSDCQETQDHYEHADDLQLANAAGSFYGRWRGGNYNRDDGDGDEKAPKERKRPPRPVVKRGEERADEENLTQERSRRAKACVRVRELAAALALGGTAGARQRLLHDAQTLGLAVWA